MRKNKQKARRNSHLSQSRTGKRHSKSCVSIIGAGRLGTALGIALKAAGYEIKLVVAKRAANARRAARLISGETVGLPASQFYRRASTDRALFDHNSLILVATPDDVIASVADELAAIYQSARAINQSSPASPVAMHTSGALSSEVLRPLRRKGFAIGSLHPLVSISDPESGAVLLARAFFSVEGDATAIRAGERIVRDLGGQSFKIKANDKALYHAAALMASPNMTALFDIALEMLSRCGLSRNRARQVLLPLVESTLANLSTQDPARALTGTFKRGDVATVRRHIAAIESQNLRDALAAYLLLGHRSLSLARKRDANSRALDEIDRLLSHASEKSRK